MLIEELWNALEKDAANGKPGNGGWLLRLAHASSQHSLFVALEISSQRRAVLLRVTADQMPSRNRWPRAKGLEPIALTIEGKAHFGVALKDPRFSDVFTALAEDLLRRVLKAPDAAGRARAFIGQLARWQKFLSASFEGLSEEAQRGLWGELYFLREYLLRALGTAAIYGWKGAEKAHQDFQLEAGALEVKTTLAKQPQVVRITSERQLDDRAWPALFLGIVAVEARDGAGESLPAMIGSIRTKLQTDSGALEQFEDALLAVGYLELHTHRYAGRGYVVRSQRVFRVADGFPRLIEKDLKNGVGDANYGLAVSACRAFEVSQSEFLDTLEYRGSSTKDRKQRQ